MPYRQGGDGDRSVAALAAERRKLVPRWIRLLGGLLIAVGVVVVVLSVDAALSGASVSFAVFGVVHRGPVLEVPGLLIVGLSAGIAVSAYGLISGRTWGLTAGLAAGYLVLVASTISMLESLDTLRLEVRLEPLVVIPYLVTLHRLKRRWAGPRDPAEPVV
jgi:hypothetical protein